MKAQLLDGVYRAPEWSGRLRNLYWHLRYHQGRSPSRVRTLYRHIAKEKRALCGAGVDPELLRLVCLYFVDPRREARGARCQGYERMLSEYARLQSTVFAATDAQASAVLNI